MKICNNTFYLISLVVASGLYLKGFLLTRHTVRNFNSQSLNATLEVINAKYDLNLTSPRPCRVFVLVIDALRLDYLLYHDVPKSSTYNQFPNLHSLLRQNATQSMLFALQAHLPTTTSQCLKTLTSGNVQALVDMGSNFNTAEMFEDNIIAQLSRKKNLTYEFNCHLL